ncbi:uncharacterized protein LOC126323746 isoform X2 [Schistocerca gregaria]|nr:uncharacterized protein LOC126323746 isoform X2 [Schistocerca gregaria]
MIVVATYNCDRCGFEVFQMVNSRMYMPLNACPSQLCRASAKPGQLFMQTRGSRFQKVQSMRLQELSYQVPIGHVPRTISVQALGELTRKCGPGDVVTLCGVFLPVANQGFRAVRDGLVADTYVLSQHIEKQKDSYQHAGEYRQLSDVSISILEKIRRFSEQNDFNTRYEILAKSIAPEIFGLEDVKKALLLQMVGGVMKHMEDGMKIRGDINICLVGDPGVAKSQLLKYISSVAVRAVYTSGKGASGVGLTAAVLKDPNTKEYVLEGGSLAVADMGICCIDEFDKMNESDRTAIHEVMEQQTISIAKAGIITILNARTSILAAANPTYSRYNVRKSLHDNINLSASLLSRFDLLFLLLDQPNSEHDRELALHVTHVHRFGQHPAFGFEPLEPTVLRAYVSMAKEYEPVVPEELSDYVVTAYLALREEQETKFSGNNTGDEDLTYYVTARTLLAILRLSQAVARIRFSSAVSRSDIEEAIRLMHKSKESLIRGKAKQLRRKMVDDVSAVYNLIRNYARQRGTDVLTVDEITPLVLLNGYSEELMNEVLDTYDQLGGIWTLSANRRVITMAF